MLRGGDAHETPETKETEGFPLGRQSPGRKLLLEQQKLEAMRRTLKNGVAATEAALSGKPGVPWLEKLPTAWYVATPVQGDVGSTNTLVRNIKDHLAYCDQSGRGEELSVGSIVTRASLLAGDYRESFYSTKLSQPVESPWLYERPAGLYACVLHRGPYQRLEETYPMLLAFLREQGCRVCGDSFETDLISYLATECEEDFILKLEVQVEKAP